MIIQFFKNNLKHPGREINNKKLQITNKFQKDNEQKTNFELRACSQFVFIRVIRGPVFLSRAGISLKVKFVL